MMMRSKESMGLKSFFFLLIFLFLSIRSALRAGER
jgi:hypothetical protein